MTRIGLIVAVLLVPSVTAAADPPVVSRIAFGSCAKQDKPQPIWDAVIDTKPQHFVFLGDNIYADTEDMEVMKGKYALLGKHTGYIKLKATCPVHATWDDHDYGGNDAGAEYPKKKESQKVFLDFFEAPKDDPRWSREGVYSAQVFGPPGKRVQLILLDARYFRSPLKIGFKPGEPGDGFRGKYAPNTDKDATVLGEAQWKWLEEQLKVPAELRLIGSGVQVVPDEHGSEMWGNFPLERKRLFKLVKDTGANGVVFLTGDRHLAEISRLPADHTDGFPSYGAVVPVVFGPSIDYAQLVKEFANSNEDGTAARYSPGKVIRVHKRVITGNPDDKRVCTSHVERSNLSIRTSIRRMTRLTIAHSKKWRNHSAAMALWFAFYNYCRAHTTLTEATREERDDGTLTKAIPTTPAMAAGLAEKPWGVSELLNAIAV